jgi:hypothetical protein
MKTLTRLFLFIPLALAACGLVPSLPTAVPPDTGPTPTPLPTASSKQFTTVADRSCLLATLTPLRVDAPQGDLLAWRPASSDLAYVGPASNSNWFVGTLHLVSGPDYQNPIQMAPDALVFGSLAWSPSGDQLAFAALRLSDSVYTLMTAPAAGGSSQDWLPGETAHTGPQSSRKAIQRWTDDDHLRYLSACGPDCDQIMQLDLTDGQVSQVGEQIRLDKASLDVHNNVIDYDETFYPYMIDPTWSADLSKIAYVDEDDRAMLLLVKDQVQYILDIGVGTPREAQWAPDNRTLALRTDDVIYLFDTLCH